MNTDEQNLPAAPQPVRDEQGRFATGNPANFGKPYQPGVSGNPAGRRLGVTYPGDWIRNLSDCSESDLKQIADDGSESISRRSAAQMLLDTIDAKPAVRGRAAIRVMDRTEGRPAQQMAGADEPLPTITINLAVVPGVNAPLLEASTADDNGPQNAKDSEEPETDPSTT